MSNFYFPNSASKTKILFRMICWENRSLTKFENLIFQLHVQISSFRQLLHVLFLEHFKNENFIMQFVSYSRFLISEPYPEAYPDLNLEFGSHDLPSSRDWVCGYQNLQKYYKMGLLIRIYLGYRKNSQPHFSHFNRDSTAHFAAYHVAKISPKYCIDCTYCINKYRWW